MSDHSNDIDDHDHDHDLADLSRQIAAALATPLTGWDTSYGGRIASSGPPWDYTAEVAALARQSPDLLDLGTGGGEWLASFPGRPPRTVATEGWAPNVPVAKSTLEPLGVEVVAVTGAPDNVLQPSQEPGGELPFADDAFHLICNRHESYLPAELWRVLAPGGVFVTQQVGTPTASDLYALLGLPEPPLNVPAWTLEFAAAQLTAAGLPIEAAAAGGDVMTFADAGALVWYLSHLPWVMPEFTVEAAWPRLVELHQRAAAGSPITACLPLFWLHARKPADGGLSG